VRSRPPHDPHAARWHSAEFRFYEELNDFLPEARRKQGILKDGRVTHGYWLRATEPLLQLDEVVRALQLGPDFASYTRCLECNGMLRPAPREEAAREVPLQVFLAFRDFSRCERCGRVYWAGSHCTRLDAVIARARAAAQH
jgi:uncharacterized protein